MSARQLLWCGGQRCRGGRHLPRLRRHRRGSELEAATAAATVSTAAHASSAHAASTSARAARATSSAVARCIGEAGLRRRGGWRRERRTRSDQPRQRARRSHGDAPPWRRRRRLQRKRRNLGRRGGADGPEGPGAGSPGGGAASTRRWARGSPTAEAGSRPAHAAGTTVASSTTCAAARASRRAASEGGGRRRSRGVELRGKLLLQRARRRIVLLQRCGRRRVHGRVHPARRRGRDYTRRRGRRQAMPARASWGRREH